MESSAAGKCIPHKSKKRVFPYTESKDDASTSSVNRSKNKMHKQNQDDTMVSIRWGTLGGVIELDTEDSDSDNGISKEVKSYNKGKTLGGVIELDTEDSDSDNGKEYIDLSSDDHDSDSAKVTKRIAGSSNSRLKKGAMKVKSSKKLAKTRPHKKSSGSGQITPMEDVILEQDVSRKYPDFKKFDMVEDYSDHHYKSDGSESMQPPKNWSKEIQKEWRILEKDLPDTIFVRAYESRMDLLRAVIIGAQGTPYHDGLFFFDVCFPKNYPSVPPKVYYRSGGLGINPNLYENGYVCLSLLGTWHGDKNEMWRPGVSTMLQVLVSIQGLILNAKPYFNEPGFEDDSGSRYGKKESIRYNEQTLICSLKTMVYSMKNPPKHFKDLVIRYFRDRGVAILTTCRGYINGVGVGVEDKGSRGFRKNVKLYMGTLVGAFKQIGVEHVDEFVPKTRNLVPKVRKRLYIP